MRDKHLFSVCFVSEHYALQHFIETVCDPRPILGSYFVLCEVGRYDREELGIVSVFYEVDNRIEDVSVVKYLSGLSPHILNGEHILVFKVTKLLNVLCHRCNLLCIHDLNTDLTAILKEVFTIEIVDGLLKGIEHRCLPISTETKEYHPELLISTCEVVSDFLDVVSCRLIILEVSMSKLDLCFICCRQNILSLFLCEWKLKTFPRSLLVK